MHNQELGDYIGAESCVDLRPDVADIISHRGNRMNRPRCQKRSDAGEKEYPPAIPSLALTDNLPPHMPWVMKKYSTSDGRLLIMEEKVKLRRYFQAHRSNGRLLLNLVPLDAFEEICNEHRGGDEGEEKFDFQENLEVPVEEINGGDERMNGPTAQELHSESDKYNGIGVDPCGGFMVAVAVAEFRPPVLT